MVVHILVLYGLQYFHYFQYLHFCGIYNYEWIVPMIMSWNIKCGENHYWDKFKTAVCLAEAWHCIAAFT